MTVLFVGACFLPTPVLSQDKIQSWPVWQKYQKDNADQSGLIKTANAQARWVDATHLGYKRDDGLDELRHDLHRAVHGAS